MMTAMKLKTGTLAIALTMTFGFYVFQSYDKGDVKGAFPYPAPGERAFAGHAVAAVGYDDPGRRRLDDGRRIHMVADFPGSAKAQ